MRDRGTFLLLVAILTVLATLLAIVALTRAGACT